MYSRLASTVTAAARCNSERLFHRNSRRNAVALRHYCGKNNNNDRIKASDFRDEANSKRKIGLGSTTSTSAFTSTARRFSSSAEDDLLQSERESMPFDVLIVGGGPSGLAASIRLKQLCEQNDVDLSVCVVEKGR